MLSGQAYTFGKKARLAVSLAWVGGFVDVVGVMELAVFTSNQTGNTAMIGQRVVEALGVVGGGAGGWGNALYLWFLVTMFLCGAMLSGLMIESARRAGVKGVYTAALAVEAILLGVTVFYVEKLGGTNPYLRGALPCLAMGLQNATITRISGYVVRTTHVTGIVTDLGLETVQFLFWLRDKALRRRGKMGGLFSRGGASRVASVTGRHPTFQRLVLLGAIWTTFVIGAGLGAVAWGRMGTWALVVPAGFLVVMIVLERITPLASVDAVDRAARDRTFLAFGIEPSLVPSSIGIYAVGGAGEERGKRKDERRGSRPAVGPGIGPGIGLGSGLGSAWAGRWGGGGGVRAPDLGDLLHRTKAEERVVLLMMGDDVVLDDNALTGLERSLQELRASGRELVVCCHGPGAFVTISHSPLSMLLGATNLCSDPEFAVARALDVLGIEPGTTE